MSPPDDGAGRGGSLDDLMPEYVLRKTNSITILRPPEVVYAAMLDLRPSDMPVATFLGRLRAPGRAAVGPQGAELAVEDPGERFGWVVLAQEPPRRLVLGVVGRFWRMDLGVRRVQGRDEFLSFSDPGHAKIVFEERLEPVHRGTRLAAETRVSVTDPGAARQLRWYWRAIGLGAHLTVRSLLHGIKRRARRMTPH